MRRLGFSLLAVSGLTLILSSRAIAQQSTPTVYVVAVRGECTDPQLTFGIVNGRITPLPPSAGPLVATGLKQTLLTRLVNDEQAKALAEAELRKTRAVRVVERIEDANFVFHTCNTYWGDYGSGRMMINDTGMDAGYRVGVWAMVIPAAKFDAKTNAYLDLRQTALWKADTLPKEPKSVRTGGMYKGPGGPPVYFGDSIPEDASPTELVKRFFKESKDLLKQLAALPTPAKSPANAASAESGVPRPVLAGAREDEVKPATGTEAKQGADDSAVKIDTSLVVVPVSVLDRDGKYIPDLKSENFRIYEDGVKQEISDFGSTETPFHVALLLDVSGSTSFRIEEIQDAALAFVNKLRPQDQVMIVAFDNSVRVVAEFTNNRDQLMRAILRTRTGSSTRVYDSLDLVLTERLLKVQGRKALIIFSDGVDTSSRLATKEQILEHVEESGTLVYSIRYDTLLQREGVSVVVTPHRQLGRPDPRSPFPLPMPTPQELRLAHEDAAKYLNILSRRSGGRYYDVDTITDMQQAFTGIAEELRRQYWIGYYPSNQARDGSYRRIRVMVDKPEAAVRAREGYRAQGERD